MFAYSKLQMRSLLLSSCHSFLKGKISGVFVSTDSQIKLWISGAPPLVLIWSGQRCSKLGIQFNNSFISTLSPTSLLCSLLFSNVLQQTSEALKEIQRKLHI
ncbi:hypothetical protein ATANTOWER_017578 [Ataeniobius toweri]|uniref:Uncharacterized protein n=1 Tax=Ataeniobius toweri TaxID=208326 RepID=A0ABU7CJB1_9TELE|nr:hypothetical protein [Ataeniobius toweri]